MYQWKVWNLRAECSQGESATHTVNGYGLRDALHWPKQPNKQQQYRTLIKLLFRNAWALPHLPVGGETPEPGHPNLTASLRWPHWYLLTEGGKCHCGKQDTSLASIGWFAGERDRDRESLTCTHFPPPVSRGAPWACFGGKQRRWVEGRRDTLGCCADGPQLSWVSTHTHT